jgi:Holliday junction resolvase RusA-like endonuclease
MFEIKIKPLSVNECWRGKRFKTDAYKAYEKYLLLTLPNRVYLPAGKIKIILEFGVSNIGSDWDNPVKPFQDILQKKYLFNDSAVYEANVKKVKVEKGKEYIKFDFISINDIDRDKIIIRPPVMRKDYDF